MNSRLPKRSLRPTSIPLVSDQRTSPDNDSRLVASLSQSGADWMAGDQVFTPLGYEPSYEYPLLVWLADPNGPAFDLGRVMKRVSLRNFLAVGPQFSAAEIGAQNAPNNGDREDAVWSAIDRVCDRLSVHPQRIYLVGQGGGGSDAFRIACRHPQSFAGVVSLGGPFPLCEGLLSRLTDVRRLPMLLCCHRNASDAAIQHTDQTLRLFHAAGAMLAMRIYPSRNDLSRAVLGDVNRWLMDEVCGTGAPQHSHCAH